MTLFGPTRLCLSCFFCLPKLPKKFLGRQRFSIQMLLVTLSDLFLDFRVLELEVILELVDIHEAGDRDTVLFENDVLLAEVDPFDHRAEVNTSFGDWQAVNHKRSF